MLTHLGIYSALYGDAPMTAGRALLIAAVGFLLVFAILGVIAVFVRLMGKGFDRKNKKMLTPENTDAAGVIKNQGAPLPDNESAGTLTLIDVTEEEAALIMAIVSNKSGIPLNRLQFNSIRLLEERK